MDPVIRFGFVSQRDGDTFVVQFDEPVESCHGSIGKKKHTCAEVQATLSSGAFVKEGTDLPEFSTDHPFNDKAKIHTPHLDTRVLVVVVAGEKVLQAQTWTLQQWFDTAWSGINDRKRREEQEAMRLERDRLDAIRASNVVSGNKALASFFAPPAPKNNGSEVPQTAS